MHLQAHMHACCTCLAYDLCSIIYYIVCSPVWLLAGVVCCCCCCVLRCAILYTHLRRVEASRDAEGLRARINDLERQLQATRTVLEQSEIRTEAMVTQQRQVSRPTTEEEEEEEPTGGGGGGGRRRKQCGTRLSLFFCMRKDRFTKTGSGRK